MRIIGKILLCSVITMWLGLTGAQMVTAAPLHEACKADLEKYCSAVTPGAGRIMACLYAHEEVISDACDEATSDMSDIIDSVLGVAGDAIAICLPDIKKHCADTKLGEGRLLSCLDDKSSELGADCKGIVSRFADRLLD